MRVTKKRAVEALTNEKHWLVREVSGGIELVRNISGKAVTVTLRSNGHGQYDLVFPSYIFQSTISHFSPSRAEVRFCRNKQLLFSLIKVLKRSAAWKFISNKEFMVVNDQNPKSNKKDLKSQLKNLYNLEYE